MGKTQAPDSVRRLVVVSTVAIDALVYELYGLTDKDVRVVENVGRGTGDPNSEP